MKICITLITTLVLILGINSHLEAQSDLKNTGILYLSSASDTIYISGSMSNASAAGLTNNGNLLVKQNLDNGQASMATGTGTLFMNGSSLQTVSGSAKFKTYDLVTANSTGINLVQDFTVGNDITVGTGIFNINNNHLQIGGDIFNTGTIKAATGTVEMNGASPQIIPANTFTGNAVNNLVISNNVSLAGADTLTGTLSFGASNKELATGGFLTIKSSAANTARIADITEGGLYSGNSVAGDVVIERYIAARKAWRLLSVPVNASGAPTINASWQEGTTTASTNPNVNPGYGVHITGGTVLNGFDQSSTNNPSIKIYNNGSNTFTGLPANPGTLIPISSYPGYMLYIRGDRSINLMQGTAAAITSTTLRMKGNIKTNNQPLPVNTLKYTVAGNPYPSAIDFETLTKSNVKNTMYIWDPKLAGTYGLGAYVTVSYNNGTGTYDITSSASPVSQYIPSGEAFLVTSLDNSNPGTLTIKETDKTSSGGGGVSRPLGLDQRIRMDLFELNVDSSFSLLDGVLATYDDNNMNAIDADDAQKINSASENIGILRDATPLSIERRKTISSNDTIFLKLSQMKLKQYKLRIAAGNLDQTGLTGFLKDHYSGSINNSLVNMNDTTDILFSVNTDPASYASDRFSIVFELFAPVPVTFTSVKAYQQQKDIAVKWTVENESGIKEYDVETSADGRQFNKAATQAPASNNGANAAYTWLDINAVEGNHYYRIRSNSLDGSKAYSSIVKVIIGKESDHPELTVYPNPVTGDVLSFKLSGQEKGIYQLELFNSAGQLLKTMPLKHTGTETTYNFPLSQNMPAGRYELKLTGTNTKFVTSMLKQ